MLRTPQREHPLDDDLYLGPHDPARWDFLTGFGLVHMMVNDGHLDNDNEDSQGHDENYANQKSNVILKAEAIKPRQAALTKNIAKSTTDPRVERS